MPLLFWTVMLCATIEMLEASPPSPASQPGSPSNAIPSPHSMIAGQMRPSDVELSPLSPARFPSPPEDDRKTVPKPPPSMEMC